MASRRVLGSLAALVTLVLSAPATAPASVAPASAGSSAVSGALGFDVHATGYEGGEPTLAILKDGTFLSIALQSTIRSTDGGKTWDEVHVPPSGGITLDPYIHADEKTGRVLSSQLLGACQMLSISDDGGKSWQDVPTACPSGDHQKIGSGPWHDPTAKPYPRSFYTCINHVGDTACQMSLDGGLTWLPPVVVFPGVDPTQDQGIGGIAGFCGGLEGDPVSGPDGTIYLPREYCGRPYVGVSTDDGVTWSRHAVAPGAQTRPIAYGGNNPSVTVDKAGTVYYAWTGADWQHRVAYSTDKGETWSKPIVVSPKGSTTFPSIIAGDKGAVATAWIGTEDSGAGPDDADREARWYLYVSYSLDADSKRAEWKTVRVSNDVAQIGCIGRHGPNCGNGNLLDFIDTAFTPQGHLAVVYADGCIRKCDRSAESRSSMVTVAIQKRGPRFR